ncbi:putative nucleic acid-binding protein, contains PIN domain [Candidatus Fervidibacteria bacterium JGI MDM2 JNZ-1-D12]
MTREIFGDTAGWANLLDRSQPFHALAVQIYDDLKRTRGRIITTNYVLVELVSLLLSPLRLPHPIIVDAITRIKSSPMVEIVHIDPTLDAEAWDLFQRRPDKRWSLVDCASFVVMQRWGITEALTTDINFEQAGFVRLLK